MKKLSLFVSAFALFSSTSYAAIDCGTLPTCESLGYTDIVAQCPKKSIKCPFDMSKGMCLHDAAIGQIGYFPKPAGKGWLLCNGQTITKADYPELFNFLGTTYCTTDHGGSCGSNTARLPDYRGYFMRAVATTLYQEEGKKDDGYSKTFGNFGPAQTSFFNWNVATPQKQGLPNITGYFYGMGLLRDLADWNNTTADGALYRYSANRDDWAGGANLHGYKLHYGIGLDASKSNSIYGSSSGVLPPNMAVLVYIYAGR